MKRLRNLCQIEKKAGHKKRIIFIILYPHMIASQRTASLDQRYKLIMVCGFTIYQGYITNFHVHYLEQKLSFCAYVDMESGAEIPKPSRNNTEGKATWRKAIYKNLEILVGHVSDLETGRSTFHLKIRGSLHKYANNGVSSGRFTALEAVAAKDLLVEELQLDARKARFTRLEIGVNIAFPHPVMRFLNTNLVKRFRGISFTKSDNVYRAVLTHYSVKLYEKSLKELRFEVHYENMQEIREKYNLISLDKLTAKLILKMATEILFNKCLPDIFFLDNIDLLSERKRLDGMANKELFKITQFSNDNYLGQFHNLKEDREIKTGTVYKRFQRRKKSFAILIKKYGDQTTEHFLKAVYKELEISDKELKNGMSNV